MQFQTKLYYNGVIQLLIVAVGYRFMITAGSLLRKNLYYFGKKIITMNPAVVSKVQLEKPLHSPSIQSDNNNNKHPSKKTLSIQTALVIDWQTMQFDKLCALSQQQRDTIQRHIKKTKMNVEQEYFVSDNSITDPQKELTSYWLDIYKLFCNMESIKSSKVEKIQKNAYLAKMILDQPETDEELLRVIGIFVNNLHEVKNLQGIAQATFCKYLLALKRDLKMQGLNIETYIDPTPKPVKIVKILHYEYQFWIDVKHNRSKNGPSPDFITIPKTIPNPNTTITLTQKFPTINITYIKRKKKRQEIEMNFVIKMQVEIEVEGKRHVVKVERKGPSDRDETELRNGYLVIDYDGVYKGNPTIRPIFQF